MKVLEIELRFATSKHLLHYTISPNLFAKYIYCYIEGNSPNGTAQSIVQYCSSFLSTQKKNKNKTQILKGLCKLRESLNKLFWRLVVWRVWPPVPERNCLAMFSWLWWVKIGPWEFLCSDKNPRTLLASMGQWRLCNGSPLNSHLPSPFLPYFKSNPPLMIFCHIL